MISIDLGDVAKMIADDELEAPLIEAAEDLVNAIYVDLVSSPPLGTPVDTGAARNSWQIDNSDPKSPECYSTSSYINRLNDGWSSQSPSGFVDAIVDKHTLD